MLPALLKIMEGSYAHIPLLLQVLSFHQMSSACLEDRQVPGQGEVSVKATFSHLQGEISLVLQEPFSLEGVVPQSQQP